MATPKPSDMDKIWGSASPAISYAGDAKTSVGWGAETPIADWQNFQMNKMNSFNTHVNENGIPEWDAITIYTHGAAVKASDNLIYTSTIPNNVGNDPTVSATWSVAFTAGKTISSDLIINVPADQATVKAALDFLADKEILTSATVTILVAAGISAETSSLNFEHTDSSRIILKGVAPVNTNISSVVSVVAAAGNNQIEYLVADATGIAIGDIVKISNTGGATSTKRHLRQEGLWEVTNVVSNNVTVKNTDRHNRIPIAPADLTSGTMTKIPSIIEMDSNSSFVVGFKVGLIVQDILLTSKASNAVSELFVLQSARLTGTNFSVFDRSSTTAVAVFNFSEITLDSLFLAGTNATSECAVATNSRIDINNELVLNGYDGQAFDSNEGCNIAFNKLIICGNNDGVFLSGGCNLDGAELVVLSNGLNTNSVGLILGSNSSCNVTSGYLEDNGGRSLIAVSTSSAAFGNLISASATMIIPVSTGAIYASLNSSIGVITSFTGNTAVGPSVDLCAYFDSNIDITAGQTVGRVQSIFGGKVSVAGSGVDNTRVLIDTNPIDRINLLSLTGGYIAS